ncbi:hypothetical protein TRAPUB_10798 [Trametes pubescens]|uniref:Uncharacterized protein n=1 Tax=Trametes pubescens TaxID=154538 RepID=A0A1M2VYI6_TRAPU|nr:hypothetical protein TRAPUB_10798 [Trametes pubescens]
MARGRKQKALEDGCIESEEGNGQVVCLHCKQAVAEGGLSKNSQYQMARGSWSHHSTSQRHWRALEYLKTRKASTIELRERLEGPYRADPLALPGSSRVVENPGNTDPIITGFGGDFSKDVNGIGATDFNLTYEEQEAYFPVTEDPVAVLEDAQALLQAQFERLALRSVEDELIELQDNEPAGLARDRWHDFASGNEQLSSSNIVIERLIAFGGTEYNAEQDEQDLEAYLSGIPADRRYPPYGSKTVSPVPDTRARVRALFQLSHERHPDLYLYLIDVSSSLLLQSSSRSHTGEPTQSLAVAVTRKWVARRTIPPNIPGIRGEAAQAVRRIDYPPQVRYGQYLLQ